VKTALNYDKVEFVPVGFKTPYGAVQNDQDHAQTGNWILEDCRR